MAWIPGERCLEVLLMSGQLEALQNFIKEQKRAKREVFENKLACDMQLFGIPAPVRDDRKKATQFHPDRKWRFDFMWPAYKIAVEVEGGIWRRGGGAHSHPLNIERDIEKHNEALRLGWRVFRFTTDMVRDRRAVTYLEQIFKEVTYVVPETRKDIAI